MRKAGSERPSAAPASTGPPQGRGAHAPRAKLALYHVLLLAAGFAFWYAMTTPGLVSEEFAKRTAFFFGRPLQVRSHLHTINGFSAHAEAEDGQISKDRMEVLLFAKPFGNLVPECGLQIRSQFGGLLIGCRRLSHGCDKPRDTQSLVLDWNCYTRVNVVAQGGNQKRHLIRTEVRHQPVPRKVFCGEPGRARSLPRGTHSRGALLEFHDYVSSGARADVGQSVRVAAGKPLDVSSLHVS